MNAQEIQDHLVGALKTGMSQGCEMGGVLVQACESLSRAPAHTLGEMRRRSKKVRGDVFELFCKHYLLHCGGMSDAWLLHEVPEDVRLALHLTRRDVGIDLIGRDANGAFYAIQAKFRRRVPGKRTCVTGGT